jgi:hypothetical protein
MHLERMDIGRRHLVAYRARLVEGNLNKTYATLLHSVNGTDKLFLGKASHYNDYFILFYVSDYCLTI